jgi:hypothetical protein
LACRVTNFVATPVADGGHVKRSAVKLTVDSNEPLEDAMRVLGALYGVTLVVSREVSDPRRPAQKGRVTRRKGSTARKPRTGASAVDADAGESAGTPSNAEVRAWARRTGLSVSDRGRVPASVLKEYRNAHQ